MEIKFKVPMKRKFLLCSYKNLHINMYDSEVLEYWGKTCRLNKRSKLGYFAFKNSQRTGSSFMLNSKL